MAASDEWGVQPAAPTWTLVAGNLCSVQASMPLHVDLAASSSSITVTLLTSYPQASPQVPRPPEAGLEQESGA